jgi:molybdopterin-guanine dinucleotide biosynthesis protein A
VSGFNASAAILAGGQARRFGGRDKSRLVVDGRSIIVRQLDVLQRVADDTFVVAANAERFTDLRVPVYADVRPNLGAIGGIYTALEVARADLVLVVACDLPFLHEKVLAELVERSRSSDGAWVRSERGVEPLIACYHRRARARVLAEIEAGRLAASGLGSVLDMHVLDRAELVGLGSSDALFENINTPDDYARVQ